MQASSRKFEIVAAFFTAIFFDCCSGWNLEDQVRLFSVAVIKADIRKTLFPSSTRASFLYGPSFDEQALKLRSEQDARVDEFYQAVERSYKGHELLVQDILVRRLANLTFDQPCNPLKQIILNHPPVSSPTTKNSGQDKTVVVESILRWQMALLQDGQHFCNYKLHLECNVQSETCQCKRGNKLVTLYKGKWVQRPYQSTQGGKLYGSKYLRKRRKQSCSLLIGDHCGSSYGYDLDDATTIYDPFTALHDWTKLRSPPCWHNSTCVQKQFFYQDKCWCDRDRNKTCAQAHMTLPMTGAELDMILDRNSVIQDNFVLNIDQECDPTFQKELLKPTLLEMQNTAHRLDKLHTISDYDVTFCDLKMYLNCSGPSMRERCDCWSPLVFQKGKCLIKNEYPCGPSFGEEFDFYEGGPNVREMSRMLQLPGQLEDGPKCIELAECRSVSREIKVNFKNGSVDRCICSKTDMAGEFCNETKALLSTLLDDPEIWPFPRDLTHNKIFHELNFYFYHLEDFMRLLYGERCSSQNFQYFDQLFEFLIDKMSSMNNYNNFGGTFKTSPRIPLNLFKEALGWAKTLVSSNILFCNGFLGLACLPIDHKCRCMAGFSWNGKTCTRNSGKPCVFKQSSVPDSTKTNIWKFSCPENSFCDLNENKRTENFAGSQNSSSPTLTCKCVAGYSGTFCEIKEFYQRTEQKSKKTKKKHPEFSFFKRTNVSEQSDEDDNDDGDLNEVEDDDENGATIPKNMDNHQRFLASLKEGEHGAFLGFPSQLEGLGSTEQVRNRSGYGRSAVQKGKIKSPKQGRGVGFGLTGRPRSNISKGTVLPHVDKKWDQGHNDIPLKSSNNDKVTKIKGTGLFPKLFIINRRNFTKDNQTSKFDQLPQEILDTMTLGFSQPCDPSYDHPDFEYARALPFFHPDWEPDFDPQDHYDDLNFNEDSPWARIPKNQRAKFGAAPSASVKQMGRRRCNAFRHLGCSSITKRCECNVTFDLDPGFDGGCHIKTLDLCFDERSKEITSWPDTKRLPPTCLESHKCDRVRYNLYRCRPLLYGEGEDRQMATGQTVNADLLILFLSLVALFTFLNEKSWR